MATIVQQTNGEKTIYTADEYTQVQQKFNDIYNTQLPSKANQTDMTSVNAQLADIVTDFNNQPGIDKTGSTDCTSALNALILSLCQKTSGQKKIIFNGTYLITGTILIPSDVVLDLNGSTILGNGYNTNTLFATGIYNGTSIVAYNDSTYQTSIERASVINGTIKNCGIAFNLTMMNRNCCFENLYFINCERSINALRCTYSTFRRLSYHSSDWSTMDASTNPAFNFQTENNVMTIESIFVQNRILGMQVYDVTSGLTIMKCSFESCTTGFQELGTNIRNLKLIGCYSENCTTGVSLTTGAEVDNCFFNSCSVGISSNNGAHIKANNYFMNCTTNVKNTNPSNIGSDLIELNPVISFNGANPTTSLSSLYNLNTSCLVNTRDYIVASDGVNMVLNNGRESRIAQHQYVGKHGYIPSNVPFCTYTKSTGSPCTVTINTKITYETYDFLVYKFKITLSGGSTTVWGVIFGNTINQMDSNGLTATLTNNSGMLSVQFGNFTTTNETCTVEGIIRHI